MKWFLFNVGEIEIDECNIPIVQSCTWRFNGYIVGSSGKYKNQYLHCIIAEKAGLDMSNEIDHKDLNKLNNQLLNLRSATRSQNMANSKSRNKSGYKGVYWNELKQKWYAAIRINGKLIFLGYFNDPKEAHKVYCKAADHYFGEFANYG